MNRPADYADSDTAGAWSPATSDANPTIGVNMGGVKMVSGIVLQGRGPAGYYEWVTKFKVAYKVDADADWIVINYINHNQEGEMVCLIST